MINQNTFNTGLNQDTSKMKYPQTSYYDAENFKIVAQSGSSTYALENTKGTITSFKLPDKIYAVYKINPLDYTGILGIQIFDNNPNSPAPPAINVANIETYTPQALTEYLLQQPSILASVTNGDMALQYNNQHMVIVGLNYAVVPLITNPALGPIGILAPLLTPEINNPQIIGAINIKNVLVLYSTESVIEKPGYKDPVTLITNPISTGQIWRIEYDEVTNSVTPPLIGTVPANPNIPVGTLIPQYHLKYHQMMNLSNWHKISGEGRYETIDSQKTYFTDYYNSGRLFNIADPNSFAVPVEVIQNKPLHTTQVPIIQNVNDGGFIKCGKIQYFYQVLHNLGTQTSFSVTSNLISLTPSALSAAYQNIAGGNQGINSGKAVVIKIENIDTLFDIIKIGYILWETEDLPTVRIFYEGSVPPSGEIVTTHSGSEKETSLSIEEFRKLQVAWDVCKGYTQKKNILIAHNLKTIPFDVDVDCRAYRFSTSIFGANIPYAYLYDKEDTYGNPRFIIRGTDKLVSVYGGAYGNGQTPPMDWEDIPQEADLINPYNNENPDISQNPFSNGNWASFSQYKYQSDGSTLGGEGPVIKYNFWSSKETFTESGDTNYFNLSIATAPFASTSTIIDPLDFPYIPTQTNPPTTPTVGYEYPVNSGLASMKNPMLNSLFTGYADGEVYRFADVFFNKKHTPSFTKWIGDIKFPLQWDKKHESFWYGIGELEFRQQGLQFTFNTSHQSFQNIKDTISGWSYVRMERIKFDKTRLGTGILNTVSIISDGRLGCTGTKGDVDGALGPYPQDVDTSQLRDYATFECPNFKFNIDNNYIPGDYIRFLKVLRYNSIGWFGAAGISPDLLNQALTSIIVWGITDSSYYITDIAPLVNMVNAPVSIARSTVPYGTGFPNIFVNMGDENETTPTDNEFGSWGGYTHLISALGNGGSGLNLTVPAYPPSYSGRPYVSYERYLANQYNGNQWEVRMGQEYISCNHYQPWDNTFTGISITTEVFGGDVVNTLYDFIKFDGNTSGTTSISGWDPYTSGPNSFPYFVGQIFPSECSFDLNLRQGRHLNNMTVHYSNPHHEDYTYNKVYSQQNSSQLYLSKPFNFREVNEQPYRMASAQKKIDGEYPDSWAEWLVNDFIDSEGTFGPINRMILQDDKVLFYQDYAVGVVAVEEQQVLNSNTTTGSAGLVLGEGTVLQRYDYISKNTGSKHQWAVITTPKGAYHFDATLKKLFMLQVQGDKFGLTDIKGLNTTFQNFITQSVQDTDIPLPNYGIGIQGEWNPKHNEVYFTILDGDKTKIAGPQTVTIRKITISYNELTDSFDSFHTWYPTLYHRLENRLLTIASKTDLGDTITPNLYYSQTMFEHNRGEYNVYHKSSTALTNCLFPSKLTIIISPQGSKDSGSIAHITKKLDVIEFITQVFDTVGVNVPFETINSIRVFDDYQDTGVIPLIYAPAPNYNIKKRFSSWRFNTLRDITSPNKARLRDKTFTVEIVFNNSTGVTNRRFIMNDIISQYEPDPFVQPV